MENNKPLRVVIDYDGNQYDSYEKQFTDSFLVNAYSAAQKIFGLYRIELIKNGAYIYMDADNKRPESYQVMGISVDMWHNILNSFGRNNGDIGSDFG